MSAITAPSREKTHGLVLSSVRSFVAAHGGSAVAVLQPVGRLGVRVTLVGADGVLGDCMTADMPSATALVAAVDGLTETQEWSRELTSRVTPTRKHWWKMAGWVAHQHRFPRARNWRIADE